MHHIYFGTKNNYNKRKQKKKTLHNFSIISYSLLYYLNMFFPCPTYCVIEEKKSVTAGIDSHIYAIKDWTVDQWRVQHFPSGCRVKGEGWRAGGVQECDRVSIFSDPVADAVALLVLLVVLLLLLLVFLLLLHLAVGRALRVSFISF